VRLRAGVIWWVVLAACYLVLISSVTSSELVTGAVVAALASTVAVVASREFRPARPPWRLVRALPRLVVDVAASTGVLVAALPRRGAHLGRSQSLPLAMTEERRAWRTYAVLLVSAAPGSYASDVHVGDKDGDKDGEKDEPDRLTVHRLGPAGQVEEAVR
jgi:multisubunit Na+/H+ antiporter MnhE subunit